MSSVEELFGRAVAAHCSGDLIAAERDYRAVLAQAPDHAPSLTNLGALLAGWGRLDEAEQCYAAALAADPGAVEAHFNLGNLYRRRGRPADAARCYEQVLRQQPGHAAAWMNLGVTAGDTYDWPAAADHLRRAIELDPDLTEGYLLLWEALSRLSRHAEAEAAARRFVDRCPDDPRGHLDLGLSLLALNRPEEATAELETALRLRPDYAEAHNALGVARERTGQADAATESYLEAVRIRPDYADAWGNLGTNLAEQGRTRDAVATLKRALDLRADPVLASNRLLLLLGSSGATPGRLRAEHEDWAAHFAAPFYPAAGSSRPHPRGSRVRVGYVWGELRTRQARAFVEALLTQHDRTRFHVTAYPNADLADPAVEHLREQADAWQPLAGLSDAAAAEQVRADRIDLLIDLCGHTAGHRLLVFARKPAPVQLTLYGYPATTGLRTIDYRVSDGWADPPGLADSFGTEKLLRLPAVARVYIPPPDAPRPSSVPTHSRRAFTFGCLCRPAKLSDACLDLWAEVLRRVPRSRLVLPAGRSVQAARHLIDRFTALGVAADRLEAVYRLPEPDYLDTYRAFDLVLDPFPFNGRTTTGDALWMGVPVLTLAGADSRGRQGLSILTNLGLSEFVAHDLDQFVALAAQWADRRDDLAVIRQELRDRMAASRVTDVTAYVRDLEAAYLTALETTG